jgi:hypothetical protein
MNTHLSQPLKTPIHLKDDSHGVNVKTIYIIPAHNQYQDDNI